ncbi:hypothetical protein SBOR_4737 [Sclerotinia borealis F-4128]|uniref:Uncharacterized protein n=1 Tax=Sclerotinia borealis (strain F-4128) TaxID=1432307 RepID=W9CG86_SCLBF|nr:hypothetical protein SBOR_4737 [Sclerotinia borealis F-4128]
MSTPTLAIDTQTIRGRSKTIATDQSENHTLLVRHWTGDGLQASSSGLEKSKSMLDLSGLQQQDRAWEVTLSKMEFAKEDGRMDSQESLNGPEE